MDAFRPTLSGLVPAFQPAAPSTAPLSSETLEMSITRANADLILTLLKSAGGSMSSADLREALSDLEQPERAKAITMLRTGSEIESFGSTTSIVYYLPGHKPKAALEAKPRNPPPPAATPAAPALAAAAGNPAQPVPDNPVDDTGFTTSLEMTWLAVLEQLVKDPDFAELSTRAKIRGAEWMASRLRDSE